MNGNRLGLHCGIWDWDVDRERPILRECGEFSGVEGGGGMVRVCIGVERGNRDGAEGKFKIMTIVTNNLAVGVRCWVQRRVTW